MADALSGTSSAKIEQFTRQSLDERPLKKDTLEKLLSDLLKSGDPEYVNELLFSKRNTEEVSGILSLVDGPEYVESSSTGVILRDLRKLAAGQKILKECNRDWHPSICYPLPRDSVCDMHLPHHLYALYRELEYPVLSGRGIWFDADVASSPDVVSSLSLGGGPEPTLVDQTAKEIVVLKPGTFNGKYVMVFCINAPVLWGSDGCQSFLNLCNELDLYVESDKIKMVMVARMNILADTEEIFKHLFSGFPKSCLAVPYGDWERRERIWKLLKGVSYGIQCSVYNTDGKFLASFCVDDPETPYGAEAFPFDKETLEKKNEERKSLREEGSLEKLLRPYESSKDVFVHDLYRSEEKKRVSEVIKNKHVGLYVCCECDSPLAPLVQKLYEQQCKIKGQEFEIVVLFLPLLSEIDPELVQEKIASLWRQKGIRGWWCLPFNNSVSLRFWGLTRGCDCGFNYDEWKEDKLIIVGSDGKILDMYGAQVIRRRDGFDAFPFTREAVVQKRKMQVKGLTLDSRLVGQLSRGNDPNDTISADMLLSSKKRIVICLGKPRYYDFQGLVSRYEKADRSKFEVVFVAFPPYQSEEEEDEAEEEEEEEEAEEEAEEEEDEAEEEEEEEEEAAAEEEEEEERVEVPWYIYRPHDGNSLGKELKELAYGNSLGKELKELAFVQSLVGFGDDGRICSLKPLADLAEVGEDDRIHSLKQLDEAGMGERWTWELCLDDTLGNDIHHLFHFDWYAKI